MASIKMIFNGLMTLLLTWAVLCSCNFKDYKKKTEVAKSVTCEQRLQALILNSSLKTPFKSTIRADVEDDEGDKLSIRLVDTHSGDQAVGWLKIDFAAQTIIDITNDPESPENLKYKTSDWKEFVACRQRK